MGCRKDAPSNIEVNTNSPMAVACSGNHPQNSPYVVTSSCGRQHSRKAIAAARPMSKNAITTYQKHIKMTALHANTRHSFEDTHFRPTRQIKNNRKSIIRPKFNKPQWWENTKNRAAYKRNCARKNCKLKSKTPRSKVVPPSGETGIRPPVGTEQQQQVQGNRRKRPNNRKNMAINFGIHMLGRFWEEQ